MCPAQDQGQHGQAAARMRRGAVLYARSARHRHRAGLRPHHIGHRRCHDRLVRTAMLCYVTPKEHLGLPDRTTSRWGVSPTRSRPTPPTSPRAIPRTAARRCALQGALRVPLDGSVPLSLDPATAEKFHDATMPKEAHKTAHFCRCAGRSSAPCASPRTSATMPRRA